jgi:hypothetical protein
MQKSSILPICFRYLGYHLQDLNFKVKVTHLSSSQRRVGILAY